MGYFYLAGGVILFILGVVSYFRSSGFTASFYLFTFGGLALAVWGVSTLKKKRQNEIKDRSRAKVDRMVGVRAVPMKKCPACGGDIESSSRICPICNHRFRITYTLTVFSPFNVGKREQLIKYLVTRTKRPYEEISIQLEKGMVFRYSTREDVDKNKASFESLGCTTRVGETVLNE
jgi:hypothetical protein